MGGAHTILEKTQAVPQLETETVGGEILHSFLLFLVSACVLRIVKMSLWGLEGWSREEANL